MRLAALFNHLNKIRWNIRSGDKTQTRNINHDSLLPCYSGDLANHTLEVACYYPNIISTFIVTLFRCNNAHMITFSACRFDKVYHCFVWYNERGIFPIGLWRKSLVQIILDK